MVRKYGAAPFTHVLIHGGPGAIGSLSRVAEELSAYTGTLEPLQSKYSVGELVDELHTQLTENASLPAVLIGHSWGAWLAALYASRYPGSCKTLILMGAGAFEPQEEEDVVKRRIGRLPEKERQEYLEILGQLESGQRGDKDSLLARLGALSEKADTYCPMFLPTGGESVDGEMYNRVWPQAAQMRQSGRLLQDIKGITCPIYVVHGADDPHPVDGVVNPLRKIGLDPTVIVYEKCGHSPFNEVYAHDALFAFFRSTVPGKEKK